MKALTTLFVVGMFLTTVAMADDADDVRAALQRYTVGTQRWRCERLDATPRGGKHQFRGKRWIAGDIRFS